MKEKIASLKVLFDKMREANGLFIFAKGQYDEALDKFLKEELGCKEGDFVSLPGLLDKIYQDFGEASGH